MERKSAQKKPLKKILPEKPAARKLATGQYKSFRLHKRIKHPGPKLEGSVALFRTSLRILARDWKLFGGIVLIYLLLNIILVKGLSSGLEVQELKRAFEDIFSGTTGDLAIGLTVFGVLVGTAGKAPSDLAAGYQSILLIIVSLVLIWALRQRLAGEKISVRDAFYKSMHPLIPYLLVLIVVVLQLLPLLMASFLYQPVFIGDLAVTALEKILWGVLLFCLAVLSFYMVTSSTFALYIVTLPDMRPMKALRSARELVRYRRWLIMRKFLFLPFILLVIAAVITIPVILFLAPIAEWFFFALTMLTLAVTHSYMYTLYRELL